jgi:methionine-gamma-lyase
MMTLTDMKAVAKIAKNRGITTMVDNTFMSPYLQRPIEHGIDVVVHSITKSLSGHSDVLGGAIVGTKAFLKAMDPLYNLGANLGPFEAWLTLRGIKTLHVRMQR